MPNLQKIFEKITFVGEINNDRFIFENGEVKIKLINIFEPIVRVENEIWLNQDCFENKKNNIK